MAGQQQVLEPSWVGKAREHLPEIVNEFLGDPQRLRTLDTLLAWLPNDQAKIIALRIANAASLRPDDPTFQVALMVMAISSHITATTLDSHLTTVVQSADQARTTTDDLLAALRRVQGALRKQDATWIQQINGIRAIGEQLRADLGGVPTAIEQAVTALAATLEERTTARVEASAERAAQGVIDSRVRDLEAKVIAASETVTKLGAHLRPAIDVANALAGTQPLLVGKIKLDRRAARWATIAGLASLIIGFSFGYTLQKPARVTLDTPAARQLIEGYTYERIYPHLDHTVRAQIDEATRRYGSH